jgi:two-component system OmpR family sensor kinase/two-component system sensor histidine kinase BaeS
MRSDSVLSIRFRLLLLLMQAFGVMVLLTVILMLGLFAVYVGTGAWRPGTRVLVGAPLQAYYLGHGNWSGVEVLDQAPRGIVSLETAHEWQRMILLDGAGRIVLDRGRADTARVGQVYQPQPADLVSPLKAGGEVVGTLVLPRDSPWESARVLLELLLPVTVISFFTGGLTLIIGMFLMRRVVTPLADVIAAAHSVAAGDLTTRVQVCGPGDLRGLSESFNHMADALERSDRERRALLADVAHELRTPLTVIRGRLEGVVDGIYPADEAHVAPVLEQAYVLERLVEDLRQLTLAETRQLPFERQPIDLGEIAARTVEVFSAEAAETGIALSLQSAPALPHVLADPQRVGQVIGNLLSNALRYTPPGGQVRLSVDWQEAGVRLAVTDTGEGIAAEDLPRVFDRFYRGEKSRARASGGAGLGLAIAKAWVQAMGGQIGAESTVGRGSCFWFTLPGAPAA